VLERDRPWAAYAIGDLSPAFAPQCEWRLADGDEALVLAYRGFDPPVAFAMGSDVAISSLLDEVDASQLSLHLKVSTLSALPPAYAPATVKPMWRMLLDRERFEVPDDDRSVDVLTTDDLEEIAGLYQDGLARNEAPDFFFAGMLDQGTFRGIREEGRLVAVAGTHIMAPSLGVCHIGNVYTRQDSRGRGLAARVTAAVVGHTLRHGATTVVLNVRQSNESARRVYERLGFHEYCEFVEGSARRVQPYTLRV